MIFVAFYLSKIDERRREMEAVATPVALLLNSVEGRPGRVRCAVVTVAAVIWFGLVSVM